LTALASPADATLVATQFKGARVDRVEELLATLASLGQARSIAENSYVAV
jgi:hypothetical protein